MEKSPLYKFGKWKYLSLTNTIIINGEKTKKEIQMLYSDETKININSPKSLTYISKLNENQKEMNKLSQILMKNLKLDFVDDNIKYEEYYFNGIEQFSLSEIRKEKKPSINNDKENKEKSKERPVKIVSNIDIENEEKSKEKPVRIVTKIDN